MLVRGRAGLAEFTDDAVRDPEVLALARRVHYELDPAIDYPRQFVGDVEIVLGDGRVVRERQDRPRGGPDAPLTRQDLEAKFRGNAARALPGHQIEDVIRGVNHLPLDHPLAPLLAALGPPACRTG